MVASTRVCCAGGEEGAQQWRRRRTANERNERRTACWSSVKGPLIGEISVQKSGETLYPLLVSVVSAFGAVFFAVEKPLDAPDRDGGGSLVLSLTRMARVEDEESNSELERLRLECRERPKHLPSRLALGDFLLELGDVTAALNVYQEALRLKPSYGKAKRKVEEAQARLLAAAVAASSSSPDCPSSSACVTFQSKADEAAALRSQGNSHFNTQCYEAAWDCYDRAIELLKREGQADAKLHTNRAACLLVGGRWVAAAYDGVKSIELDPEWWKGHFYLGQGLLGQLKGKRPSASAQHKAERALVSLERTTQCSSFPEAKRERVEQLQARARHVAFYLAQNQCPQS